MLPIRLTAGRAAHVAAPSLHRVVGDHVLAKLHGLPSEHSEQEPRSSEPPSELEDILRLPIPFEGSSTPADAGQAQRYAFRLEERWKLDMAHRHQAMHHLTFALGIMVELPISVRNAEVQAAVRAARELLL